jgi:hypothetical protein
MRSVPITDKSHISPVMYLIQAKAGMPEIYDSIKDRCVLLSYGEETEDTDIFFPDSTWTTGRNKLHEYASSLETLSDYYVFLDEDIEFEGVKQKDGFERFEANLSQFEAPIMVPDCWGYNTRKTDILGLPKEIQRKGLSSNRLANHPVDWFDGCFIAFRQDAFFYQRLLPYDSSFDSRSWWVSQFIMILRSNVIYRNHVIQINGLRVRNGQSGTYIRGHDGFIDAYNKVLSDFKIKRIRMTSKVGIRQTLKNYLGI